MKILKLGDLHIGVKRDDPWVQNIQLTGIRQAIKISKEHGIKQWIQAGDWFDTRSGITHKAMEFNRKLCEEIKAAGIKVDVIVGNHDATFKNTLTPNACDELLTQFDNFTVYSKPATVDYDGLKIDLVPWMCEDNIVEILNFIGASKSKYNIGHYELNGFLFYQGLKSHGIEPDFLSNYDLVEAGHFHTQSEGRNIRFIGTPYTLTSGDENDIRGFWIFDTETKESTFVKNDTMWHRRIHYPGSIDVQSLKNLSVRVVVTEFDAAFTKLESELESVVHDLKIINKVNNKVELSESDENIEIQSLLDLMYEWIDCLDDYDSDTLKQFAKQLYMDAQRNE